jgi:hypothetical protein
MALTQKLWSPAETTTDVATQVPEQAPSVSPPKAEITLVHGTEQALPVRAEPVHVASHHRTRRLYEPTAEVTSTDRIAPQPVSTHAPPIVEAVTPAAEPAPLIPMASLDDETLRAPTYATPEASVPETQSAPTLTRYDEAPVFIVPMQPMLSRSVKLALGVAAAFTLLVWAFVRRPEPPSVVSPPVTVIAPLIPAPTPTDAATTSDASAPTHAPTRRASTPTRTTARTTPTPVSPLAGRFNALATRCTAEERRLNPALRATVTYHYVPAIGGGVAAATPDVVVSPDDTYARERITACMRTACT